LGNENNFVSAFQAGRWIPASAGKTKRGVCNMTQQIDRWSPPCRWTPSGTNGIQILNALGECVMAVGNNDRCSLQINISDLPKGIYFVKVGGETAKFVKM